MKLFLSSLRLLARLLRTLVSTGGVLLVVLLLAFNVATLTLSGLNLAVSAALESATGLRSIAARRSGEARALAADRDRARSTAEARGKQLRTERARSRQLGADLARARSTAEARGQALARARSTAEARGRALDRARFVTYRGQRLAVGAAVEDTARRISRRTAASAARNLGAIPGEGVPLFGIAVILAATAWELKDACDLMGDVHELRVALDASAAHGSAGYQACGLKVPSAAEVWRMISGDPEGVIRAQPEEYGPLPEFEEPGWWDWAMAWFNDSASLEKR